jgi:membrane fusion protein, multidrug efflux system
MKKYKFVILVLITLVIITALLIPKIFSSGNNKQAARPQGAAQVLSVTAHITKSETLQNKVNTTGTILANEEVELRSETSGKITSIHFTEGTTVTKGTLLVKINDEELKAQLDRAKYRLKLLQDREYRQKILLEKEAISQEDYDVSLNELNVAKSEIDLVQAQLNKTEIKAPFTGKIGLKNVSEGSFVNNTTVIATLQNIKPVKIDFSIPEKYSAQVSRGDKINFSVTGSEEKYTAEVYAVEPKIDPVSRTLQIRAIYRNPGEEILPGSFANVQLVLKEIKDAILIPTQAVVPELKGQKVYLYKSGKAVPQEIITGTRTEETVQVTSGLSVSDTVITSGILQIRPGIPVRVTAYIK